MPIYSNFGGANLGQIGSGATKRYAEHKAVLDAVDELDRLDIFDSVEIVSDEYERPPGGRVGIPRDDVIHRGLGVVFPHQAHAAKHFLRNLRGIGILADEVGLGKTYETGLILSELAKLGLIESLLIVAANCDDWRRVMGDFGIDKMMRIVRDDGAVGQGETDCMRVSGLAKSRIFTPRNGDVPKMFHLPILMDPETFALEDPLWRDACFDAIVVDEAHRLGPGGMATLGRLMQIKDQRKKPYCILVSGTPHRGKLADLFPLWLFAYNRGLPVSAQKERELAEHFHQRLCLGVTTIAEYVDAAWQKEIAEAGLDEAYRAFVASRKDLPATVVRAVFFQQSSELAEQAEVMQARISRAYYDNLINSCMIRGSRAELGRKVGKRAINYYFCPIDPKFFAKSAPQIVKLSVQEFAVAGFQRHGELELAWRDIERLGTSQPTALTKFADEAYRTLSPAERRSVMFGIAIDALTGPLKARLERNNAAGFFRESLTSSAMHESISNRIRLVPARTNPNARDDSIDHKAELLIDILSQKSDKRVVIFFDGDKAYGGRYNLGGYVSESTIDESTLLVRWLDERKSGDSRIAALMQRLVIYDPDSMTPDTCCEQFYARTDSILLAKPPLNESFNLQRDCHTVINFSISADPVEIDQAIGRVDRIGQSESIEIISFACMNELEGYLLAFYNDIALFSDWQTDVINAAGCNSEARALQCRECGQIVLRLAGHSDICSCGSRLGELRRAHSYKCNVCNFTLNRQQVSDHSYPYVCPKGEKLYRADPSVERYGCSKLCIIAHCNHVPSYCLHKRGRVANSIMTPIAICDECVSQHGPCSCHVEQTPDQSCVSKCAAMGRQPECRVLSIDVSVEENRRSCPICLAKGNSRGKLRVLEQASFSGFARHIWSFATAGSEDTFTSIFRTETQKVQQIVDTLKRVPKTD